MSPRPGNYHGSFEHPLRSFLVGVCLLALLFAGFAVGTGVSDRSAAPAQTTTTVRTFDHTRVDTVTVALPGSTEVVSGRTVVVPGPTRIRRIWVQVPEQGPVAPVIGVIRQLMEQAATYDPATGTPPPVTVVQPVTVTQTETVTGTETVTETVTTTGPTSTDSSDSTGP